MGCFCRKSRKISPSEKKSNITTKEERKIAVTSCCCVFFMYRSYFARLNLVGASVLGLTPNKNTKPYTCYN